MPCVREGQSTLTSGPDSSSSSSSSSSYYYYSATPQTSADPSTPQTPQTPQLLKLLNSSTTHNSSKLMFVTRCKKCARQCGKHK